MKPFPFHPSLFSSNFLHLKLKNHGVVQLNVLGATRLENERHATYQAVCQVSALCQLTRVLQFNLAK